MEPDMNRHERRTKLQRVSVHTQVFQNTAGNYYWFVEPRGWRRADGPPWRYAQIHGPFATAAEAAKHKHLFSLDPRDVTGEQLTALAEAQTATEH
jgi:hypothetical protein